MKKILLLCGLIPGLMLAQPAPVVRITSTNGSITLTPSSGVGSVDLSTASSGVQTTNPVFYGTITNLANSTNQAGTNVFPNWTNEFGATGITNIGPNWTNYVSTNGTQNTVLNGTNLFNIGGTNGIGGVVHVVIATDYGPDTSGVNDSTAALQAGLNACATYNGGNLTNGRSAFFIPAGKYKLTGGLLIPPGVHVYGESTAYGTATRISTSGNNGTIILQQPGEQELDHLYITGPGSGGTTIGIQSDTNTSLTATLYVSLHDLFVTFFSTGVYCSNGYNWTIQNCNLSGNSGNQLVLAGVNNAFRLTSGNVGGGTNGVVIITQSSSGSSDIQLNTTWQGCTNALLATNIAGNLAELRVGGYFERNTNSIVLTNGTSTAAQIEGPIISASFISDSINPTAADITMVNVKNPHIEDCVFADFNVNTTNVSLTGVTSPKISSVTFFNSSAATNINVDSTTTGLEVESIYQSSGSPAANFNIACPWLLRTASSDTYYYNAATATTPQSFLNYNNSLTNTHSQFSTYVNYLASSSGTLLITNPWPYTPSAGTNLSVAVQFNEHISSVAVAGVMETFQSPATVLFTNGGGVTQGFVRPQWSPIDTTPITTNGYFAGATGWSIFVTNASVNAARISAWGDIDGL